MATPGCYGGAEVVEVEVTALRAFIGASIAVGVPELGYQHGVQFGPLQAGQSVNLLWPVGQGTFHAVFEPNEPGLAAGVEVDVPTCPRSPTNPTFTAEVERCADEDDGAISVTVTNPVGGPEHVLQFSLAPSAQPQPYEWSYGSLSIEQGTDDVAAGDGERTTVIVDELSSGSRTRGLSAGDYVILPAWEVEFPRDPAITSGFLAGALVDGEPIHITLPACEPSLSREIRVASFDASLTRAAEGELLAVLSTRDDPQAAAVAEIIQRTRPDVLLLNGFDYDYGSAAIEAFRTNYLAVAHGGADPIEYRTGSSRR